MSQEDAPGDTQRGIVAELEISLVSVTRFVQDAEAVTQRCSIKKVFLEIG